MPTYRSATFRSRQLQTVTASCQQHHAAAIGGARAVSLPAAPKQTPARSEGQLLEHQSGYLACRSITLSELAGSTGRLDSDKLKLGS